MPKDVCDVCHGTGKYKEPNDQKEFDEVFEKYDKNGAFPTPYCLDKAYEASGYTEVPCWKCSNQQK